MMNVVDAINLLSTVNREGVAGLDDTELACLADLDYVVALAKDAIRKRKLDAESKAIQDKAIARRNLGITINDMVNKVKTVPEYKQLCMLGNLLAYSKKKAAGDGSTVKLTLKIEEILDKHDLNDPRIIAHLENT
jgi:hypothetical protein